VAVILLVGATGLIGGHVAALIPADQLHIVARRRVDGLPHHCVDVPENWPDHIAAAKPKTAISTLGTTIKQAGSKAAFRAVDYGLVLSVATAAKAAGARQFIMVSSVGASAQVSNFYLKTKGEAEDAVKALGFDRVDILRPGLLKGAREGPARPVEAALIALTPITDFLTPAVLSQYRSVEALSVAQAIAALVGKAEGGVHIHHNAEMLALAREIG
jgi:uncharacterized protein YbjT (DUF2867 family)